jgi:hypothetical protein
MVTIVAKRMQRPAIHAAECGAMQLHRTQYSCGFSGKKGLKSAWILRTCFANPKPKEHAIEYLLAYPLKILTRANACRCGAFAPLFAPASQR